MKNNPYTNKGEKMETEEQKDEKKLSDSKRKEKLIIIFSIVGFLLAIGTLLFVASTVDLPKNTTGASKEYIEFATKDFLKQYSYYPNTVKIKTIDYAKSSYKEEGYELWRTNGYFTAKNAFGMELKSTYVVYIIFKYDKDMAYKYKIYIDGKCCYDYEALK